MVEGSKQRQYERDYYERNKEKLRETAKKYYKNNKDKIQQRRKEYYLGVKDKKNATLLSFRTRNPELVLIKSAKERAKKRGYAFNLVKEDVYIPEYCPLLGLKLESQIGKGKSTDCSPSLDRIIPEKGYVKGNVWVVSMKANRMKSDSSLEEMKLLVENWSKYENQHLPK
jgi:hypothetical protein